MNIWGLTNTQAAGLLRSYEHLLFSSNVSCNLLASSEYGVRENTGHTRVGWNGIDFDVTCVNVYVPDAFSMKYLKSHPERCNENANILSFVSSLVAIAHERQHLKHYEVDIGADYDMFVFSDYAAQSGNPSYYLQNYFSWFTEADAQYRGLYEAYKWIGMTFDKDSPVSDKKYPSVADELILKYQVNRFDDLRSYNEDGTRGLRQDFVPVPKSGNYESVQELFKAYDTACRRLLHTRMEYDYGEGLAHGDEFAIFLYGPDDKSFRKQYYEVFAKSSDGFRQNLMAACTNYILRRESYLAQEARARGEVAHTPIRDRIMEHFGVDLGANQPFRTRPVLESVKDKAKEAIHNARNRDIDRRFGNILDNTSREDRGPPGPKDLGE